MKMKKYDVIIVGGGATGTCMARDCALRGLKTLLIEREDLCDGASGRNHGLLHSGARYAVNDPESARECIVENLILKQIASNCVEDTGGLFISLPEDGLDYQALLVQKCAEAGIDARIITPKKALSLAPAINPNIIGAVKVPDASVNPFLLSDVHALDAVRHGADIIKFKAVTAFIKDGDAVVGVKTDKEEYYASQVVIASGIWSAKLVEMAGAHIDMYPSKGALLVFGHRVTNLVINRCRKPSNADILVPEAVVSVFGTTSDKVPFEECDNMRVTREEVDFLLKEGVKMLPSLASTRIIRAYAGVRPLISVDSKSSSQADGRSASRGIVLLDHEERDGVPGLITITGGKLTTARLMAEKATDLVCKKLGIDAECTTAEIPLPGSYLKRRSFGAFLSGLGAKKEGTAASKTSFGTKRTSLGAQKTSSGAKKPCSTASLPVIEVEKTVSGIEKTVSGEKKSVSGAKKSCLAVRSVAQKLCFKETIPYAGIAALGRHGSETLKMDFTGEGAEIVCECEQVTSAEISYCVKEFGVRNLNDLRRHTRIGMGTCQGSHCIQRAAELLAIELSTPEKAEEFMKDYLQERWKGMTPVMWGETLREAEFMRSKYSALLAEGKMSAK
jgi:glycerol-3-phosphate dehydrogenase